MRYDNEEVFAMKKWMNVLLLCAALLLPALALADGPVLLVELPDGASVCVSC